jgi:hypothetical protein
MGLAVGVDWQAARNPLEMSVRRAKGKTKEDASVRWDAMR